MFLGKHQRYFRRFEFSFTPRHKYAPVLPLVADAKSFSIYDALHARIKTEKALDVQPNGDTVELMKVEPRDNGSYLALLFHRASPNAADPAYRRKALEASGVQVTVRKATKNAGEEQSVSAHLLIRSKQKSPGRFPAVLEEIPGISMSTVRVIIAQAISAYEYNFTKGAEDITTSSSFKFEGVPSESLEAAMKNGRLGYITLVRQANPDFVDADGILLPQVETMRIKVGGHFTTQTWKDYIPDFIRRARAAGWEDIKVDLDLDDNRKRTVRIDRESEAKEILFVRSEELNFKTELDVCSIHFIEEVLSKASKLF